MGVEGWWVTGAGPVREEDPDFSSKKVNPFSPGHWQLPRGPASEPGTQQRLGLDG